MKKYTLLSLLALVIVTVSAAMPMFPNLLEGSVTVNGGSAADGTAIEVKIGGVSYGDVETSGGRYELAVNGLTQDDANTKTIYLYVSNHAAGTIVVEDTSMPKPARVKDLAITVAVCGNNLIEDLETCDGTALNSKECTDYGYSGGTLSCKADCSNYDKSQCTNPPPQTCGNSIIEGTEFCDKNSEACTVNGYAGTKICNDICSAFNSCSTTEKCGDSIKNGNEICDGSALGGQTCSTKGFSSGTLKCKLDCTDFDSSACTSGGGGGGGGGNPPSTGPTMTPLGLPLPSGAPPAANTPAPTAEPTVNSPSSTSEGADGTNSVTGAATVAGLDTNIWIIIFVIVGIVATGSILLQKKVGVKAWNEKRRAYMEQLAERKRLAKEQLLERQRQMRGNKRE